VTYSRISQPYIYIPAIQTTQRTHKIHALVSVAGGEMVYRYIILFQVVAEAAESDIVSLKDIEIPSRRWSATQKHTSQVNLRLTSLLFCSMILQQHKTKTNILIPTHCRHCH
jgi:hypothetical protein